MNKTYSTRFIISWALLGLALGALLIYLQQDHQRTEPQASAQASPRDSYADAVNKVSASVVSIKAYYLIAEPPTNALPSLEQSSQPKFKIRPNKGSGVIISNKGYIVTNHHVVAGAEKIEVILHDGRQLSAKILGLDPDSDLAVITAGINSMPAVTIANSDNIRVGDIALAIGNPFGIGQTVTQGIISATGRDRVGLNTYENFIQTDAAINPGNSGGALINSRGEIVGINSAIYSQTGNYLGISFAIPINLVLDVVQQIIENGEVIRGWLGVEGVDLNPQMLGHIGLNNIQGVLITDVFDRGPAEMAGIRVGDILTHINKSAIRDTRDVLDFIAQGKPGDKVQISGIRERQSFVTEATLGQRPAS